MPTDTDKLQTGTDKNRQSEIRERLLSLIDKAKTVSVSGSIYRMVRVEFDSIANAREALLSWREIAEACRVRGKEARMRDAFMLERQRRKKKGEEGVRATGPKPTSGLGTKKPDAKAKIQKESVAFSLEDKAKGGRIGPPKPIGRGRLDLGENTPDDEL